MLSLKVQCPVNPYCAHSYILYPVLPDMLYKFLKNHKFYIQCLANFNGSQGSCKISNLSNFLHKFSMHFNWFPYNFLLNPCIHQKLPNDKIDSGPGPSGLPWLCYCQYNSQSCPSQYSTSWISHLWVTFILGSLHYLSFDLSDPCLGSRLLWFAYSLKVVSYHLIYHKFLQKSWAILLASPMVPTTIIFK